jgi:mannose-6-phosphate isomerase-like protein (cupin superfamily)
MMIRTIGHENEKPSGKERTMQRVLLGLAALFTVSTVAAFAQPKAAIDITDAQIKEVLRQGALRTPPAVDQTLRVIDMGDYAMSVGIIHRGPTGQAAAAGAGRGRGGAGGRGAAGRGAGANVERCGETAPEGATLGPGGMIAHDDTVETYIIVSGGGTLITGGTIVNGVRSGPESEVTKILNGPSCSGRVMGDFVSRKVTVGDVIVIPNKVPHGWTDITDHVDYLSVRPDPHKVLEHGYVNPAIK